MYNIYEYQNSSFTMKMRTPKHLSHTKLIGLGSLFPLFNTFSTPNKLKSELNSTPSLPTIINSEKLKLTYEVYNSNINVPQPPPVITYCDYQEYSPLPFWRGINYTGFSQSNGISSLTSTYTNNIADVSGSSPVVDKNGNVYICSTTATLPPVLYSFSQSGNLNWNYTLLINSDPSYVSPCIGCDGTIYINADHTGDSSLFAISPSGNNIWTKTGILGCTNTFSPIIIREIIFVGTSLGNIYGYNTNGDHVFFMSFSNIDFNGWNVSGDDDNGLLFISGKNVSGNVNLYCINISKQQLLWTYSDSTPNNEQRSTPAISGNLLFIGMGNNLTGYLLKINKNNGQLLGQTISYSNMNHNSPLIGNDGYVYIGTESDGFLKVNPDNMTVVSTFKPNINSNFNYSSATMDSNSDIYLCDYNNQTLYCISNDMITQRWSQNGNFDYSSPAIGLNGRVYMGGTDGFYVFE